MSNYLIIRGLLFFVYLCVKIVIFLLFGIVKLYSNCINSTCFLSKLVKKHFRRKKNMIFVDFYLIIYYNLIYEKVCGVLSPKKTCSRMEFCFLCCFVFYLRDFADMLYGFYNYKHFKGRRCSLCLIIL